MRLLAPATLAVLLVAACVAAQGNGARPKGGAPPPPPAGARDDDGRPPSGPRPGGNDNDERQRQERERQERERPPAPAPAPAIQPMSAPSTMPTGCPNGVQTRFECRELSDTQRQALFDAFRRLMTSGAYDKYVEWHVSVTSAAHGTPEFLPWHREYLRRLEVELGVPLCYWDWASDAQVPEASPLLMPGWGGTNGAGNCMTDGFWGTYNFQGDCVMTQWDGTNGGIGAFYSIDYVARLIQENASYDAFRVAYEGTAHARVHNGLGGGFSRMTSPANPVFFFHHTNVDRHWAIWQWAHPNNRNDYPRSTNTPLAVFQVPVSAVMDTQALCYTYSNLDIINTGRATIGLLQRRSLATTPVEPEVRELDSADHLVRLHRRTGCGNVDPTSNFAAAPCDEDRTNLVDLREVRPAPEWWIKMEGLNCSQVRYHEEDHLKYITSLNRLPGYVSPSALYNRPQLLKRVVETAPDDAKFYVYAPGSTCRHDFDMCKTYKANPEEAVRKIRHEVEKAYPVESYDKIKPKLEKLVGCKLADALVTAGKNRANKPYHYSPPKEEDDEQEYCPAGYDWVEDDEDDYDYDSDRSHRGKRSRRRHRRHRRHGRDEL